MVSPIEQLKCHFLGDRDFTSNFVKFVGDTVKRFNNAYFSRAPVQFVISALQYNVKNHTYTTKEYNLEAGETAREVAHEMGDSMIGISHPIYCVGYVISADGWVSREGESDEKENSIEMIIHTVVSITDVSRMSMYEIVRSSGEIKNSGIKDVNSTLKSALTHLFSTADRSFIETYNNLNDEEKKSVKKNIFE